MYGIIKIQWIDGEMWRNKAGEREIAEQVQPAHRGNIYSSDGKILATTVPICDLYLDLGRWEKKNAKGQVMTDSTGQVIMQSLIADSNFYDNLDEVCRLLHEAVPSKPAAWFRDRIVTEYSKNSPKRCFLIERNIPYSCWVKINKLQGWSRIVVKNVDYRSVITNVRALTYGNMAENTIGFHNSYDADKPYTGLEGYYNTQLKGNDGIFLCRRLTRGVWIPIDKGTQGVNTDSVDLNNVTVRPVVHGKNIVSTIDTRYQDIAETALRKALRQYHGGSGTAILMEVETGYVLACCNLAKDTHTQQYLEMRDMNIAVSDLYEPGSTFKAVILTAMMNDSTLQLDTTMRLRTGYKKFPCTNGEINDGQEHPIDTLSLKEAFQISSNVAMCEMGWMYYKDRRKVLGNEVKRIFPYEALRLDVTTGERNGYINNDIYASGRSFLNFCYGYVTMVSPMQLITFYNALAAGGRMVKPLFCRGIQEEEQVVPIEPIILNERICSPQTAAVMKDLLVGVVEHGTGNNIKNSTYGIAGKTGTSVNSYSDISRNNASFVGFFPADKPKYTCLVVIRDIHVYGRQTAEVFKSIADCVMATDKEMGNIKMEEGHWRLEGNRWVKSDGSAKNLPYVSRGNQQELQQIYKQLQLDYVSSDNSRRWVSYSAGVDSLGTPGHYVTYLPKTGVIPDCTGMTVKDAMVLLHQCGYNVRFKGVGKVTKQTPRGGTKASAGTTTVHLRLGI